MQDSKKNNTPLQNHEKINNQVLLIGISCQKKRGRQCNAPPPRMVPCEGLCQRVAQRLPTSGKPLRPFKEPTPQQQCQGKGSSHAQRFKGWHIFIRGSGAGPAAQEGRPTGRGPREAPIPPFQFRPVKWFCLTTNHLSISSSEIRGGRLC